MRDETARRKRFNELRKELSDIYTAPEHDHEREIIVLRELREMVRKPEPESK